MNLIRWDFVLWNVICAGNPDFDLGLDESCESSLAGELSFRLAGMICFLRDRGGERVWGSGNRLNSGFDEFFGNQGLWEHLWFLVRLRLG